LTAEKFFSTSKQAAGVQVRFSLLVYLSLAFYRLNMSPCNIAAFQLNHLFCLRMASRCATVLPNPIFRNGSPFLLSLLSHTSTI
jgi:hypothetical protein